MSETQVQQRVNIFERAVILKLSMSRPGNERKISTSLVEVDTDKRMLRVSKKLLECAEFKAIATHLNSLRSDVRAIALPSPMGAGHWLIPLEKVEAIDKRIVEAQAELETVLVPAMMAVYEQRCQEAMASLKDLANAADYPPAAEFEAAFGIFHSYMTYGTPQTLAAISKSIFDRETKAAQAQIAEATDAIVQMLVADFSKLLSDLVERIQSKDNGNSVKFKGLLDNVSGFLETLKVRNITENADLNRLADQARTILDGIDSKTLDSSRMRDYVRTNVATVRKELDTISSTVAPLRRARFIEVAGGSQEAAA